MNSCLSWQHIAINQAAYMLLNIQVVKHSPYNVPHCLSEWQELVPRRLQVVLGMKHKEYFPTAWMPYRDDDGVPLEGNDAELGEERVRGGKGRTELVHSCGQGPVYKCGLVARLLWPPNLWRSSSLAPILHPGDGHKGAPPVQRPLHVNVRCPQRAAVARASQ